MPRRTAPRPAPAADPPPPDAREAFRRSLHTAITNATPHDVSDLVREDKARHDERDLLAKDRALLEAVIDADAGDEIERDGSTNLYDGEREAFPDMLDRVKEGRLLTQKQRNWVYSAADRLGVETNPVRSEDVPRGREVELAPVLAQRPLAPPGRKAPPEPPVCSRIEEQVAFGFGLRRGHGFEPSPEEGGKRPCTCGGKGLGVNGFHYPGAEGCLLVVKREPETPAWLPLLARLLALPETKVAEAYKQAVEQAKNPVQLAGGGVVYRTPEGDIDNCALVNGEAEQYCQVCKGKCPDRGRIREMIDAKVAEVRGLRREVLNELRTGRADVPMPFDDLPDFDARPSDEEDDSPF